VVNRSNSNYLLARDPAPMLATFLQQWGDQKDLWIFAYGSLIWRQDFEFSEQRPAKLHGWHRALKMWSRINRGTPAVPGLVFALLSGGSCRGVLFRVPAQKVTEVVNKLWLREMMTGVYDPRTLNFQTDQGPVQALAFTLSRRSPNYTGELSQAHYQQIFSAATGRFGTTRDYALQTLESLQRNGIKDAALTKLLKSI
jgi:cation transport protein ChaC